MGVAGRTYALDASTDLSRPFGEWSRLATTTPAADGEVVIADPAVVSGGSRLYRVVVLP
jgi:hypothetical protein